MSKHKLAVFWHPDVLLHDPGRGCYEFESSPLMEIDEPHPETADRIVNIRSALRRGDIRKLIDWHDGRHAGRDEIERFHTEEYVDSVIAAEDTPPVRIDGSGTVVNVGSVDAAFAAAGTTLDALDAVLANSNLAAYALVRPPGHHAGRETPDGNCIFNNLAIAVESALRADCQKVAVIDWDAHHGNGTQSGFYDRPDVMTISIHMPLGSWGENHPETGAVEEIGSGEGKGFNMNIPLPYGSGDQAYVKVMQEMVGPAVARFDPDLIVIACGQDANQFDQNGRNLLSMRGFRNLGRVARELADDLCDGRLLLCQEGGYAITYSAFCMYAVAEGILGIEKPMEDPLAYDASIEQPAAPFAAVEQIAARWRALVDG
ncbi:MAG: class II histone deacetylase [Gammaproteobacteria bacterium]|nr:class II histone deacetylase [Gammaproteobacteria bacterium]